MLFIDRVWKLVYVIKVYSVVWDQQEVNIIWSLVTWRCVTNFVAYWDMQFVKGIMLSNVLVYVGVL